MKTYIITGFLLFSFVFTNAESQEYKAAMKAALKIHDDAQSAIEEVKALEAFEKVTRDFPNEWLANYWAAYLCTQVARLKGRADDFPDNLDPKELVRRAQKYFEKAKELNTDKSDERMSDLHMLQGFIYNWFNWLVAESEEEKEKFKQKGRDEYFKATQYNPQNPIYYVMIGIDLTNSEDNYRHVVAGIAMLKYAKEIFSKVPDRSTTTYWNKDFIGFWKSRAEKKLDGMLSKN